MKSKAGFTLIEITVSLVLVGLIASIAGTSVIMGMRGYLFARENDVITQKAQLALSRLNREIIELSDIKDANSTCVVYESPYGPRAIKMVVEAGSTTIKLFTSGVGSGSSCGSLPTGDTLVDGVQSFSIYYNPQVAQGPPEVATTTWVFGSSTVHDPNSPQHISRLYALRMELALARQDTGGSVPFVTTASPRNNNNSGGASPPTASNPPPEYSGKQCFVTTAAWGDPDHPVVEVLRQFRDRVLVHTALGEALIRYYYEVGPSLASAIEDKPFICLIVRLIVLPMAGLAFLALSCPILIPLILFLSWGIARLILREIRRRSLRWAPRLQRQRGAMLVTLIATMVVFSALGAIMLGMFGTSALSQTSGNNSMRAYYLAESGLRYAASSYIAVNLGSESANETERNRLLKEDLHNKEFALGAGDGKFQLHIYPYYYRAQNITGSSQQWLNTEVSGGYPLDSSKYKNGSWVQITKADGTNAYEQILGASLIFPNTVQFTKLSGGWNQNILTPGSATPEVTPACKPDTATSPTITDLDGDGLPDLRFVADSGADAFPPRNGIFTVNVIVGGAPKTRMLTYRELDTTSTVRLLKGVTDPSPGAGSVAGLTLDPSATKYVALTKFMKVESTGTVGSGTSAVSRKVTYYVPIGHARAEQVPKTQFHDQMENFANWRTGDDIGRIGTLRAGTSYGTTMRVDTTQVVNQAPGVNCLKFREFQVGLNWSGAGIPIQQEWLRAGNYLSYDLEVKAYYTLPAQTAKHALGLTFRLDEQGNALGFTYARGVPGYTGGCDNDGIPHGWLGTIPGYTDYTPVLLFWMKQYDRKETGIQVDPSPCVAAPTTISDPPKCGRATKAIFSTQGESFWQNGDRVRFTNTGGALPPPILAGRDYYIRKIVYGGNAYLYLFSNETGALGVPFDPLWPGLVDITDYGSGTTTVIAQDPTFTKLAHQVMDSGNEYYKIFSSSLHLLDSWASFMVRVIEAPSVSFINGGGASGREILSGETVYQTSDNLATGTVTARYHVTRNPVYRASSSSLRNWAGNAAQGVILLERIQGDPASNPSTSPFTTGRKIFVGEHPGGTWAATVGVPGGYTDQAFRARDNWVLFYVGDPTANLPADSNPFNNFRGAVLRNSVLWPPDSVEDTVVNNDNYTLLRFEDYVNTTYITSFGTKNNIGTGGDVLRFTSPDGSMFYSPQSGTSPDDFPTKRSEVGLHAYGNDGNSVEYDDFGLQFGPGPGPSRKGFLMPIQQ